MAQRWMQAKLTLARTHGIAISGARFPTGKVLEDRKVGREPEPAPMGAMRDIERHGMRLVEVSPVLRKVRGTVVVLKVDKPKPFRAKGTPRK